jgi:hypothetical protein
MEWMFDDAERYQTQVRQGLSEGRSRAERPADLTWTISSVSTRDRVIPVHPSFPGVQMLKPRGRARSSLIQHRDHVREIEAVSERVTDRTDARSPRALPSHPVSLAVRC